MSGTTTNYSFPYPESTDAPDGATQIQSLAGAVDTALDTTDTAAAALATRVTAIDGAWTDFSPTLTGITIGNGTLVARYRQMGKTVQCRVHVTFGSTTSALSTMAATLPVAPHGNYASVGDPLGTGWILDSSAGTAGRYGAAAIFWDNTGNGSCFLMTGNTTVAATAPFTFASGDQWAFMATYETA